MGAGFPVIKQRVARMATAHVRTGFRVFANLRAKIFKATAKIVLIFLVQNERVISLLDIPAASIVNFVPRAPEGKRFHRTLARAGSHHQTDFASLTAVRVELRARLAVLE